MSSKRSSGFTLFTFKWLGRLPLAILYIISDIVYFILHFTGIYRQQVVFENLRKAFPSKSGREIKSISRKFFRHFSDLTVEIIKMSSFDKLSFSKRMKVKNSELPDHYFNQGRSVIVLTMHYNNWEWGTFLASCVKHKVLAVYKPLHDKRFNSYLNKIRSRFGAEMVSTDDLLRRIIRSEQNQEPVLIWLAGDQTPPHFHKYWTHFLNQETIFYNGPASISQKFNYPIIFQHIKKVSRGHYETRFELIAENPVNMSSEEIMSAYIDRMEQVIEIEPQYYLWSHKRWKHKRPTNIPLIERSVKMDKDFRANSR